MRDIKANAAAAPPPHVAPTNAKNKEQQEDHSKRVPKRQDYVRQVGP